MTHPPEAPAALPPRGGPPAGRASRGRDATQIKTPPTTRARPANAVREATRGRGIPLATAAARATTPTLAAEAATATAGRIAQVEPPKLIAPIV